MQDILNQFIAALVTALMAVLLALIPLIGAKIVSYLSAKKAALIIEKGAAKYNAELVLAQNVWGIVDEYFRITPTVTATIEAKIDMFSVEILKKIPYLTADEIDHLRQAVAGIVNQTKELILAPAIIMPVDTIIPSDPNSL